MWACKSTLRHQYAFLCSLLLGKRRQLLENIYFKEFIYIYVSPECELQLSNSAWKKIITNYFLLNVTLWVSQSNIVYRFSRSSDYIDRLFLFIMIVLHNTRTSLVLFKYNHKMASEMSSPFNFLNGTDGEKIHLFRLLVCFAGITIRCKEGNPASCQLV